MDSPQFDHERSISPAGRKPPSGRDPNSVSLRVLCGKSQAHHPQTGNGSLTTEITEITEVTEVTEEHRGSRDENSVFSVIGSRVIRAGRPGDVGIGGP